MKILLDFDDVIFNTKKFKKDYFKIFKDHGVPKKVFDECYYDPLDEGEIKSYNPIGHIERICDKVRIDASVFEKEVEDFLEDTSIYVFPDVGKFLENFQREQLVILSFSKTNFQKAKIYNSGIYNLFARIEIVDEMKGEAVSKMIEKNGFIKKNIFFIDDRAEQIKDVKIKCPDVTTILCARNEGRYHDRKNKFCDYRIKNLKELERIISYGHSHA